MNKHLTLIGSVVILSAFGLTACDSATAVNEKKAVEVAKPAVEQVMEEVAEAPKAAVQSVVATAAKVETTAVAATEVASTVKSIFRSSD